MTPDDLTAYRAKLKRSQYLIDPALALALCDELEAAWAENEELNERIFNAGMAIHWRERAERAEAEAEAAMKIALLRSNESLEIKSALARVLALCDASVSGPEPTVYNDTEWGLVHHADIRAALEGAP